MKRRGFPRSTSESAPSLTWCFSSWRFSSIKRFVDALSHILTLASLVGIVSIRFALGLLCSIALVSLWYVTKHLRNHNNPPQAPVDSRSEKIHLLLLTSLGGAIVFGQIALAIGMRPSYLFWNLCSGLHVLQVDRDS